MKKLIAVSIRRRVTVAMFTIAVLLFGFVSFTRLKINLLPELSYPTLTIRTEYEGAAPAEIENLITKPIEEVIGVVKNVQKISSISRSGQSDVILEFAWGTDMDYAVLDVREKMDAMELPLEVQRPVILRFDPSLDPVIRFGLFYESANGKDLADILNEDRLKTLRRYADEQIKRELESALGVAAVRISGGLEDEIQVLIDQMKLARLQLPVAAVAAVLGEENVNLSGGRLEEGSHQFLIRTLNQFQSVGEMGDVIVETKEGIPIYLRDIATVRHGYKERKAVSRLNGMEAVEIAIYKEGDANTVSVSREVSKHFERVRNTLPDGIKMTMIYDQAVFIKQAVNEVIYAGLLGGLLAILILYFFLRNFWTTVIISLSIPVSVIATFNLMYGTDLSLNIMSLGGIALGIGMLLDNSIVVLENISRYRERGRDIRTAALDGASEVGTAVTASTLTTIAVFFPLVFVKGIAGQLFRDQALTITFALLASLFVALSLIPMLASTEKKRLEVFAEPRTQEPRSRLRKILRAVRVFLFTTAPVFFLKGIFKTTRMFSRVLRFLLRPILGMFSSVYTKIEMVYPRSLIWSLNHKATILGVSLALLVVTVLLIPSLGIELIPQLAQGEFRVEFRLPPGTPLDRTDGVIASVQNSAGNIEGIQTLFSVAGTGERFDANPEHGGEHWGELSVNLIPGSKRSDEEAAMDALRRVIESMPGVQYKFYRPTLFSFRTPVEVEVAGFDLDELKEVSSAIVERMSGSERFADIKSSMDVGHPEIQIHFDRERAASLGLNVYEIADRVVTKVRGEVATRYSWRDRKIDVLVRSRENDRASIEDIGQLIINPQSDRPVPLQGVADIIVGTGPSEIRRVDQERVALITANLSYGDLGSAAYELTEIIEEVRMPRGLTAQVSGQNEEMKVSFQSLRFALLLAIFLVYLVMASQFESFLHPFVIIFTIPLAFIGAVFALWITGAKISVVVFIGAILLAGIVVNNAIVLIDRINQIRAQGVAKGEAIIEAGGSRLRPILMTMLTTTLGLLPLAIGIGEGAEVRAPMAITVIGGLSVSTLLTLIVIPVVYNVLDRKP
ncbi:MAG: efflux RND transporter permease subunit [Candidatus Aminicenantes bacterium]|jgi:HAE1 family hydrophobic/amphiphilic exporter-1